MGSVGYGANRSGHVIGGRSRSTGAPELEESVLDYLRICSCRHCSFSPLLLEFCFARPASGNEYHEWGSRGHHWSLLCFELAYASSCWVLFCLLNESDLWSHCGCFGICVCLDRLVLL